MNYFRSLKALIEEPVKGVPIYRIANWGFALRFVTNLLLLITSLSLGWSVARHPDADVDIPEGLRLATVRILGFTGDRGSLGSGTVISIKRDAQGHGGWLCVLTADHNVGHHSDWKIGFRNGTDWSDENNVYTAQIMIRGPRNIDRTWVDLAMLGVRVDDLRRLPNLLLPTPGMPYAGKNDVVIAGFGSTGRIDRGLRNAYRLVPDYGTYRNGNETIHNRGVIIEQELRDANGNLLKLYKSILLEYSLSFAPTGAWPPLFGDAYFLSGDSGGPTTQWKDLNNNGQVDPGEVRLVGVHSFSNTALDLNGNNREDADEPYFSGYRSYDVQVGYYLNWIERSCAAVPEPASMTALGVGLLALLARRRRNKA